MNTPEEMTSENQKQFEQMKEANKANMKEYQQICPSCGYCPTCGRPRGNFNYPFYPWTTQPLTPLYQVYCSGTTPPSNSNCTAETRTDKL